MTVLTGKLLDETARAVWGDDWIAIVSERLHRARRTLQRYRDEERNIPPDFRAAFERMVEDQMMTVAAAHSRLRLGVGDEF